MNCPSRKPHCNGTVCTNPSVCMGMILQKNRPNERNEFESTRYSPFQLSRHSQEKSYGKSFDYKNYFERQNYQGQKEYGNVSDYNSHRNYQQPEKGLYNRADPIKGSDGASRFGYEGQGGREYLLD